MCSKCKRLQVRSKHYDYWKFSSYNNESDFRSRIVYVRVCNYLKFIGLYRNAVSVWLSHEYSIVNLQPKLISNLHLKNKCFCTEAV